MAGQLNFADYLAITELKANYFRAVDGHNWQELLNIFTADAEFRGFGFGLRSGAQSLVTALSSNLAEISSQHQGFNPVFRYLSDTVVRGVWAMRDELHWQISNPVLQDPNIAGMIGLAGQGYYQDEYTLDDGVWRISKSGLLRTRVAALTSNGEVVYDLKPKTLDPDWLQN